MGMAGSCLSQPDPAPHGWAPTCTPSSIRPGGVPGIVASRHLAFRLAGMSNRPPGCRLARLEGQGYRRWLARPRVGLVAVSAASQLGRPHGLKSTDGCWSGCQAAPGSTSPATAMDRQPRCARWQLRPRPGCSGPCRDAALRRTGGRHAVGERWPANRSEPAQRRRSAPSLQACGPAVTLSNENARSRFRTCPTRTRRP